MGTLALYPIARPAIRSLMGFGVGTPLGQASHSRLAEACSQMPPKGSTARTAAHAAQERRALLQLLVEQCRGLNIPAQIPALPFHGFGYGEVLPALLATLPGGGTEAARVVEELRQCVKEVRASQGYTRNIDGVESFMVNIMRPLTTSFCPRADPAAFAEAASVLGITVPRTRRTRRRGACGEPLRAVRRLPLACHRCDS